jgi:hypothetical protein
MLPVNHMNEWEDYGMNEDDDEIMIFKIYIYVLHVHYMNKMMKL